MKPTTANTIPICFARSSDDGLIRIMAVVSVYTSATTTENALKKLQTGLEYWMYETDEGKEAFSQSGENFDTGAMLSCFDSNGIPQPSLKPFLEREGIYKVKCLNTFAGLDYINYDIPHAIPVNMD